MNMNLKGIMNSLGAQPGQVVSDPFARAFAPAPVVKEETINEEDHEVSMAQKTLDDIIKNATELKAKIGEAETDLPAWIQDHISNSANYIDQAASGFYKNESINEAEDDLDWGVIQNVFVNFLLKNTRHLQLAVKAKEKEATKLAIKSIISGLTNAQKHLHLESINEVSYTVKAKNAYEFINGASAVLGAYLRDEKLDSSVKASLQRVIKDLEGLRKYFFSKKDESINEARLMNIVNSIVETPVIGKLVVKAPSTTQVTEAKKYDVGAGFMGNGLTIWNRAEEENNDYRIIAHIDPYGKISIRDKEIPSDVMKMIKDWAEAIKKGDK